MDKQIQAAFNALRHALDSLKPGREKSLVLTKVDEAEMWTDKIKDDSTELNKRPLPVSQKAVIRDENGKVIARQG